MPQLIHCVNKDEANALPTLTYLLTHMIDNLIARTIRHKN